MAFAAAILLLVPVAASADSEPEVVSESVEGLAESVGEVDGLGVARTSERAETPIAFTMLGFTIPEGADLWFRTSENGRDWEEWTHAPPMGVDDGPDSDSDEGRAAEDHTQMTDAFWVGESQWLQTAVFDGDPAEVTAHLIDAHGASQSLPQRLGSTIRGLFDRSLSPAEASTGMPGVVSRAEWGADETWRRGDPRYADEVKATVVHHTAGGKTHNSDYSRSEAEGFVRGMYSYHARTLGWNDIGYNLIVDRFGTMYEGRYGGLDKGVVGAHAGGFNTGTFGISVIGDFHNTGYVPTSAALDAVTQAVAWKAHHHGFDPAGDVTLTSAGHRNSRHSSGGEVLLPTVFGHRDVTLTACPGDQFYSQLPDIRKVAAFEVRVLTGEEGLHPIVGDWEGDGIDNLGWYDNGEVHLRRRNGTIRSFTYGEAGDIPIVGDWNGDGYDTIGVVREGRWYLRFQNRAGPADLEFRYGRILEGDYPLAGDWNGNGIDTVGIVRDGEWHLRNRNSGGPGQIVYTYGRVRQGDVPFVGDWNGDGQDTPAIVRGREWHLRSVHRAGPADHVFVYGGSGDIPVVGDWNGSRVSTPGMVRGNTWLLRNFNSGGRANYEVEFVP